MYFATFQYQEKEVVGVLNKDKTKVFKLSLILEKNIHSLLDFITIADQTALDDVKKYVEKSPENEALSLDKVKILAPIPKLPRNAICLGLNYADHIKESHSIASPSDAPINPVFFSKACTDIIGTDMEIDSHPNFTDSLDYEVELAVVVGKEGLNIKEEEALDYVFGYTILNGITARDIQKRHLQWLKGKSLDTFAAMGPFLVHKSSIDSPLELDVKAFVNGELRQDSHTRYQIFSLERIISELSQGFTLKLGDVISTGTPAGVGMGFNPPKYLKAGDEVECSIEKLGTLRNVVR
ncbi:MAG: fumarylacetoacetate hydrolase family protein [Firmicutes bacterium]|nr:fumarylacetoacetate hydrolase family protein [Bacillota bacterium]MDD4264457.1 fumarylacetoacetate hydrolase family protein [Bacillota bacterium]MDD4694413.1 fumarylacetoacetate hydrolase family protein [Bacillota bacterium]